MLEAEELADCHSGDFYHTSGSSCASGSSDALRGNSIEARNIINRTGGVLEAALACEVLGFQLIHCSAMGGIVPDATKTQHDPAAGVWGCMIEMLLVPSEIQPAKAGPEARAQCVYVTNRGCRRGWHTT